MFINLILLFGGTLLIVSAATSEDYPLIGLSDSNCKNPLDFECSPGVCIDIKNVCNNKEDCSNGMDENNCGNFAL